MFGCFEQNDCLSHEVVVVIPRQVCLCFSCDALLVELVTRSTSRRGEHKEDVDMREIWFCGTVCGQLVGGLAVSIIPIKSTNKRYLCT